jgi:hypothetical protein
VPFIDDHEAADHAREVSRRAASLDLSSREVDLLRAWARMQALAAKARRPGAVDEAILAAAQHEVRRACGDVILTDDVDRYFAVGDLAAVAVVRRLGGFEAETPLCREVGDAAAVGVAHSALRAGFLDRRGRLQAHPVVALTLVRIGWRIDCGLVPTARLEPVALDAYDAFRLQFGRALPIEERLRALERFAERYPAYDALSARAALLLDAGARDEALMILTKAVSRAPGHLGLRNHLLFVRGPQS